MESDQHSARGLEGELVGGYLVHKQIGRGGMASVFLAERLAQGQGGQSAWVALKVMHPHLLSERKAVDRFIEEIGMTSLLKHPHICSLIDLGEHEGLPFLVMPLLKGRSLAELLQLSEPPPPEVTASIWLDLARGLSYAHNLKDHAGEPLAMIHRDISPHNAFVEYSGHAKLLDFGIAKLAAPGRREETSPLMGKIAYMSPEQLEEEPIDHRIDVWSLAVTFWELCAYRPLFDARQPMRMMYQVLSEAISPPSEHRPVPEVFDQVTLVGLTREVDQRPSDVLEWLSPLEAWLRAQIAQREEERALSSERFEQLRAQRVAEWMEARFDLSQDIMSARLSAEDREERLKVYRAELSREAPAPVPVDSFSPLQRVNLSSSELSTMSAPMIGVSSTTLSQAVPTPSPLQSSLHDQLEASSELVAPHVEPPPPRARRARQRSAALLWGGALLLILISASLIALRARAPLGAESGASSRELKLGQERLGGVMIESPACEARVYLLPERKLLGQTPLSQTFKVGVYKLRLEPLKRHRRRCAAASRLIEVDDKSINSYEINLER